MKVALLTPVYWPEVRRGTERFARELADGLVARGHAPRIVTGHAGLRFNRCAGARKRTSRCANYPPPDPPKAGRD